jgi:aminoglycoside phosphotransferase family enzyme/predicted kinase
MGRDFAAERAGQERIIAWLLGLAPDAQRIDTHASTVVLLGERAYKLKRALDVGWMDFSTLAKREAVCRNELALNRRTAPDLYLEVVPVTAAGAGFALGGAGEPVEWLLVMRRFDQAERFDRLLATGQLTPALAQRLADRVAAFHAAAEVSATGGGQALAAKVAAENARDLATPPLLVPPALAAALAQRSDAAVARLGPLLEARRAQGFVRRCHGDLHLANIVRWQGEPTLYDCIEFNEAFVTIDLLYDLAFLLMDLDRHGRRDLANLVLNRWLVDPAQIPGLAALPLFLSLRAGVRAKVAALGAHEVPAGQRAALAREAGDYAARALDYLEPRPPRLVAVGGLSGSGKSTLARKLAPRLGAAPGALLVRSDVIRKRFFGVAPETRLPDSAYTAEWHQTVAQAMLEQAAAALAAGQAVILDAVYGQSASRGAAEELARRAGVPFDGFWLDAPATALEARVAARRDDASDATVEVVRRQLAGGSPTDHGWRALDAAGDADSVLAQAQAVLGLTGPLPAGGG